MDPICWCRVTFVRLYEAALGKEELRCTWGGGQSGKETGALGWEVKQLPQGQPQHAGQEAMEKDRFARVHCCSPGSYPNVDGWRASLSGQYPLLSIAVSTACLSFCHVSPANIGVSLFSKWNPVFSFLLLSEFTSHPGSSTVLEGRMREIPITALANLASCRRIELKLSITGKNRLQRG